MDIFLLCIKIFFARILDVSLGTFRTVNTVKDKNIEAALIGLIEVAIWFFIVKEALNTDSNSIFIAFSYALGFSVGTYIGGLLSKKLIKLKFSVQVITSGKNDKMVRELRKAGYAVTVLDVMGANNKEKYMLFIEIDGDYLSHLKELVKSLDPKPFIVVNETKLVHNGYFNYYK